MRLTNCLQVRNPRSRDVSEKVCNSSFEDFEGTANVLPKVDANTLIRNLSRSIQPTSRLSVEGRSMELRRIQRRTTGQTAVGFGADVRSKKETNIGDTLKQVTPEDLVRFGMIPEFIGRLPIKCTLDSLNETALTRILTEPKHSLVKQYQALLEMDNVKLKFTPGALRSIAKRALEQNTGARGLRGVIEEIMLDVMYNVPSNEEVVECVVGANGR